MSLKSPKLSSKESDSGTREGTHRGAEAACSNLRGTAKAAAEAQALSMTDENAIALCEYHDVVLEPGIRGNWSWQRGEDYSEGSMETQAEAAQDAVKSLGLEFPVFSKSAWEIEAGQGNTQLGYADWVIHQEELHGFYRVTNQVVALNQDDLVYALRASAAHLRQVSGPWGQRLAEMGERALSGQGIEDLKVGP